MPKITHILQSIDFISFLGNEDCQVSFPIPLDVNNNDQGALMWISDKNLEQLNSIKAGTILCSTKVADLPLPNLNLIRVHNPRNTFRIILETFFVQKTVPTIAKSAVIHDSVRLGTNIYIGENVVIEEGCTIGNNVEINHNTVLYANTIIGDNVKIGTNNSIGGVGFGYEKDQDGTYLLIPHLGNVILMDNVHIGNNTTIDRAVMGSTILQENVKVDNLVHIAHGVNIGQNSLIIANSMIAGSCVIGKNVWVSPTSSILNKLTVADNSLIGMGAVVVKNVNSNEIVVGNPAKPLKERSN